MGAWIVCITFEQSGRNELKTDSIHKCTYTLQGQRQTQQINWQMNTWNRSHTLTHWPVLVGTAEAGEDHVAETAGSVQFGLTFSPLDRALQPSTEETLERMEEESNNKGTQMEKEREDVHGAELQRWHESAKMSGDQESTQESGGLKGKNYSHEVSVGYVRCIKWHQNQMETYTNETHDARRGRATRFIIICYPQEIIHPHMSTCHEEL